MGVGVSVSLCVCLLVLVSVCVCVRVEPLSRAGRWLDCVGGGGVLIVLELMLVSVHDMCVRNPLIAWVEWHVNVMCVSVSVNRTF